MHIDTDGISEILMFFIIIFGVCAILAIFGLLALVSTAIADYFGDVPNWLSAIANWFSFSVG